MIYFLVHPELGTIGRLIVDLTGFMTCVYRGSSRMRREHRLESKHSSQRADSNSGVATVVIGVKNNL
jgi:hypothetical protein